MNLVLKNSTFQILHSLPDGSGQNFAETRQDKTIKRDKNEIQDKTRHKRCMSRQDKTFIFSEI